MIIPPHLSLSLPLRVVVPRSDRDRRAAAAAHPTTTSPLVHASLRKLPKKADLSKFLADF